MHIKKFIGYVIMSQILSLIFFLVYLSSAGIEKCLKEGLGYIWLASEGITVVTIIILWLVKLGIDWIYNY